MSELKSCPFCGRDAHVKTYQVCEDGEESSAGCYECQIFTPGMEGPYGNSEAAIQAWNSRVDNWISVEDRLPEIDVRVDVWLKRNAEAQRGIWKGDYWRIDDHHSEKYNITDVTHWQPLPKPPEA